MSAPLTLDQLRQQVDRGAVDTVLLAITDMQGRLQGKRLTAQHFVDEVAEHGAEGCNYLLAVDVDMETVEGYAMSSWERGYGDFVMQPDFETLRPIPWHEATVLCLADVDWEDGSDVVASPRQILRRQLARLAERGWTANAGTELEFMVFRDTYEEAWHKGYRDLEPANLYNVDYSLLGTARVEPLIRRIRNSMAGAGMTVENSKGECNFGQHEINFRYGPALRTADDHAIYKNGRQGDRRPGGHGADLHGQVRRARGQLVPHPPLARAAGRLAGVRRRARDLRPLRGRAARRHARADAVLRPQRQLLQALRRGLVRPDRGRLGPRQPHLRAARRRPRRRASGGEPPARRRREPLPRAQRDDRRRAARHRQRARARAAVRGQRLRRPTSRACPETLRDARDLFAASAIAREAFGDEVVDHYLNNARVELDAFDAAVTDWERFRGFERL